MRAGLGASFRGYTDVMEEIPRPTIRGVFVKSHLHALERVRGREGLNELHRRFGRPLNYSNGERVPVADEVAILEHIVDMLSPRPLSPRERSIEAGRLHFRDFRATPAWNFIQPLFHFSPKFVLMRSRAIAEYVFKGIVFVSEDLGERMVKITIFNNDYPLEHFKGFFEEWLMSFGLHPQVEAVAHTRGRYEYTISWK